DRSCYFVGVGKGGETRQAVVERATEISSRVGLSGLSIGALATSAGLSKSGVYAHFLSKEEVQRAVVRHAREQCGARVRRRARATEISSRVGLSGLSIGALATSAGLSKSGVYAHFLSKEELQLAVLRHAREQFVDQVLRPALSAPRGEPRLRVFFDRWLVRSRE